MKGACGLARRGGSRHADGQLKLTPWAGPIPGGAVGPQAELDDGGRRASHLHVHFRHVPALSRSCHQHRKVDIRSLQAFGLANGALPESRCQRFAQGERNSDHRDQGQTDHDAPNSHEPTRGGTCFHEPTLVAPQAGVLIERTCRRIDGCDESRKLPSAARAGVAVHGGSTGSRGRVATAGLPMCALGRASRAVRFAVEHFCPVILKSLRDAKEQVA